jgi:hypothetical protein
MGFSARMRKRPLDLGHRPGWHDGFFSVTSVGNSIFD